MLHVNTSFTVTIALKEAQAESSYEPTIRILLPTGDTSQLDLEGLKTFMINLADGLNGINIDQIIDETYRALYDRIPYSQVNDALVLTAVNQIEANPEYSLFASRLLKHKLCEEVISTFEESQFKLNKHLLIILQFLVSTLPKV